MRIIKPDKEFESNEKRFNIEMTVFMPDDLVRSVSEAMVKCLSLSLEEIEQMSDGFIVIKDVTLRVKKKVE